MSDDRYYVTRYAEGDFRVIDSCDDEVVVSGIAIESDAELVCADWNDAEQDRQDLDTLDAIERGEY